MIRTLVPLLALLMAFATVVLADEESAPQPSGDTSVSAPTYDLDPPEDAEDEAQRLRELIRSVNAMSQRIPGSKPYQPQKQVKVRPQPWVIEPLANPKATEDRPADTTPDDTSSTSQAETIDNTDETQPTMQNSESGQATDKASNTISQKVLTDLRNNIPESVVPPIRIADTLYKAGRLEEAMAFYESCLEDTEDDDDRAWILYQMASCCRATIPSRSQELLVRLMAEYPDSQWAPIADVQSRLLQDLLRYDPARMIAQANADGTTNQDSPSGETDATASPAAPATDNDTPASQPTPALSANENDTPE